MSELSGDQDCNISDSFSSTTRNRRFFQRVSFEARPTLNLATLSTAFAMRRGPFDMAMSFHDEAVRLGCHQVSALGIA